MDVITIVIGLICLVVGFAIAYFIMNGKIQDSIKSSNEEADRLMKEARSAADRIVQEAESKANQFVKSSEEKNEAIKLRKIQEAKEKFNRLRSNLDKEKAKHKIELKEREVDIVKRETEFKVLAEKIKIEKKDLEKVKIDIEQRDNEVSSIKINLEKQLKIVSKKKEELDNANEKHIKALEKVANLSEAEAREQILEAVKAKSETEAMAFVKRSVEGAKITANKEAKKIVIQTIQRTAAEHAIENTVSVFNLESDDQKGQIIGREGRNIRALEAATGCEIVVDDTPEAIIISGYDPIRREICRLSLQRLTADGRIHPARIEEIVKKTKKQLEEHIREIGQRTVIDLGISGLHPELVRYVGRMRFRSSYGQNLLQHSRETANLCATMAAEMGLNPKLAKRAGLLHDIGKVPEEDSELSHALLGMKLCKKYGEHDAICNAVGAHHDEVEMKYAISPIVQACDAISGARPGARREVMDSYLERIKDLEDLALDFDGVEKVYAIQAGRELRVIVESEKVTDQQAENLSFEISQKIEKEMTYPGQVKVTVIREMRSVSVAR